MANGLLRMLGVAWLGTGVASAAVVWQVGRDDGGWPFGDGGGVNTSFVQENGLSNALPGNPANVEAHGQGDDDYYFAGEYNTVLDGSGYVPVGTVLANEEGAERAFAGTDNSLRYHFNLTTIYSTELLSVTFDANNLHGQPGGTQHYGVEVYFNGVLILPEVDVNPGTLDFDFTTPEFTLGDLNAKLGPGFDNYVELRGINYNGSGGGNWMGVDYVQLNATPIPEPSRALLFSLFPVALLLFWRPRRSR